MCVVSPVLWKCQNFVCGPESWEGRRGRHRQVVFVEDPSTCRTCRATSRTKPHGGGVGHDRRGGGTTRVDRIVDNHPGIPPLPKLNRSLPPDGRGGLNSTRTQNLDGGIDPDVSAAGSEDANKEHRADPTVHASQHHHVCFAAHGHQ